MDTMDKMLDPKVLMFATKIERPELDEFRVVFNRGETTLEVKFVLRKRGFRVTMDVNVLGDHAFWIQANSELSERDITMWNALADEEFAQRSAGSEENAARIREEMELLTEGL